MIALWLAFAACSRGGDTGAIDSGAPEPSASCAASEAFEPRLAAGELLYAQLGLGGFALGESAIVVGPSGATVLVDVGNDSHDDAVLDALDALDAQRAAAGWPARPPRQVDAVLITHFHADHADGLADLLGAVTLTGPVIHRGLVDLTPAANPDTVDKLRAAVAGRREVALCDDTGCPGLDLGALDDPDDAGPTWLHLGEGAALRIVAANGRMGAVSFVDEVGAIRSDDGNGENARSVVGVLEHGRFRLLFAGDLTTASPDSDPVEDLYAPQLASELGERGVDVLHLSHHARDSSNGAAWLDALLPRDGRDRNAVAGVSRAHLGSPHAVVVSRVIGDERLGSGALWTTRVAAGGTGGDGVIDAQGGAVVVGTGAGGDTYAVQAGPELDDGQATRWFHAARCD